MDSEVKEYKIVFVSIETGKGIIPISGGPDFTDIGLYDAATQTLKLSGKGIEWASFVNVLPGWTTPDYRVTKVDKDAASDGIIRIVLTRYFDYYEVLLTHDRYYKSLAGEQAVIYLSYNGNNLKFDPHAYRWLYRKPYHFKDVQVVYKENPFYYETQVGYREDTKNFPIPKLQQKPTKKVYVTITNRELQPQEIWFSCAYNEVCGIPYERVRKLPIEIEWKPGSELRIKASASGYVTVENKYSAFPDGGRIEIELKKTLFMKLLLPMVFFVCAFLMFCAGGYCVYMIDQKKISELNRGHRQKLEVVNSENDSLKSVVGGLMKEINQINNLRGPKERHLRHHLITSHFTQYDIKEYKRLIGGSDKYSTAAENCLFIINVKDREERETIWTEGSPLNQKMEATKEVLTGFYAKLMKDPTSSNSKDGKYKTAYEVTKVPEDGFKTLDEAYKAYYEFHVLNK